MTKSRSRILAAVHQTAAGLRKAVVIDQQTMREFDVLCIDQVKPFDAAKIRRLRARAKASQAVFAAYLNTSTSTVQKWETGQKKPSGPALKLLNLVAKNGLEALT